MLNRVVLIGRLTRDPELRYTQSGIAVTSFTLAVDRAFKNAAGEKETDFIDIVVWRQLAENCANYLSKGKLAAVDGSLEIRPYTDKEGNRRKDVHIRADNVRFLAPKSEGSGSAAPQEQDKPWAEAGGDSGDGELPF